MDPQQHQLLRKFDEIYSVSSATSDDHLKMTLDKLYRSCGVRDPQRHREQERITLAWELLEKEGLRGKTVLDYGCGSAKAAVVMAQHGASVVGFDLSPISIELGRRRAQINGVADRLQLLVASGESLPFPDAHFDIVFGYEILFYLNHRHDFGREVLRVLKPGGKAIFCEALGGNPLIRAARATLRLMTGSGTRIGTPLTREDIQSAFRGAAEVETYPLNILAMAKRLLAAESELAVKTYSALKRADAWLMQCPPAQRLCGEVVLVVRK